MKKSMNWTSLYPCTYCLTEGDRATSEQLVTTATTPITSNATCITTNTSIWCRQLQMSCKIKKLLLLLLHPFNGLFSRSTCRMPGGGYHGMVNVDLYSDIITKVSNALNTLVSREKPGFQALSKGLVVLLCAEVVRQRVPDHGAVHIECSASNSG